MSNDNSVTLTTLRDLIQQQGTHLGKRLGSVEEEIRMTRHEQQQHGLAIARLPCAQHGARMARLSEEVHRLGGSVEEVTGVTRVSELEREFKAKLWKRVKWALTTCVAVLGAVGAFIGGHSCGDGRVKVEPVPMPMPVPVERKDAASLRGIDEGVKDLMAQMPPWEWLKVGVHPIRRMR